MWDTSSGTRRLTGFERLFFAVGALDLALRLHRDPLNDWTTDVPVFDRIPIEDRPFVMLSVAEHLLGDGPPPKLLAWNEGAVVAAFNFLEHNLVFEIDQESLAPGDDLEALCSFRILLHEAWMEIWEPGPGDDPWDNDDGPRQSVRSTNLDAWLFKLEFLMGRILWDDDCRMEEFFDMPPSVAREIKAETGIPEDYYSAAPPFFPNKEKKRLLRFATALETELQAPVRASGGRDRL